MSKMLDENNKMLTLKWKVLPKNKISLDTFSKVFFFS